MTRFTRLRVAFLLLALAAPGSAIAAALDDASTDVLRARASVPEPQRKVGEVRLISRGEVVVVQTLLSTKLLSRVISEIGSKEERSWPRQGELADASKSYLAALDAVREELDRRVDSTDGDRRKRMLIEFAADDADAKVFVGTFAPAGDEDLTPKSRKIFATLAPPRDYVLRNIRLILADSFRMNDSEIQRLGPLGPASAPLKETGAAAKSDSAPGETPGGSEAAPAPPEEEAPAK